MRIFDGAAYRDATAEEIAAFEQAAREEKERRESMPPSADDKAEAYDILMGGAV